MFAGDNRVDTAARSFLRDRRGVAAIEFAFIAGFLCLAVLNVSDIGIISTSACRWKMPPRWGS